MGGLAMRSGKAAALMVATSFASWPVLAQQVDPGGAGEQRNIAELDAIVVTAQKRSERLQDVPIAIETLGEAALATGPVTDITAIQMVSPAVSGSGNSSAQPLIAVRGIVSNDFSIGGDPALGIYVDDVYTGRSAGAAQELVDIIMKAGTVVWNGPVGVFEFDAFAHGTETVARAVAASTAFSIAGGGDTLAAIAKYGIEADIGYISTGGGAFLEVLEGKTLPAFEILARRAAG
jgi:hypothetical protein